MDRKTPLAQTRGTNHLRGLELAPLRNIDVNCGRYFQSQVFGRKNVTENAGRVGLERSHVGHAHLDGFSRARELADAAAGLARADDRGGASAHAVRCRTRNAAREVAGQAKEGQGEEKPRGGEDREAQVESRARGAPWEPSEHAEERSP